VRAPERIGPWIVRALVVVCSLLLTVSSLGWWASRSVTDPEGFGDRVVAALDKPEVRRAIAEEVANRLAPVGQVFTAAKPLVVQVLIAALDTDLVRQEVRNAGVQLARNVLRIRSTSRSELDVSAALVAVQEGLRAINPEIAARIPESALKVPLNFTQSRGADLAFTVVTLLDDLWSFTLAAALGVAVLAVFVAADRRRALRAAGIGIAATGAVLLALSVPGPQAASLRAPESSRSAVAAGVAAFTAPLDAVGSFWVVFGLVVVAVAVSSGPATVAQRIAVVRAWMAVRAGRRIWRIAGWAVVGGVGLSMARDPMGTLEGLGALAGLVLIYLAAVGVAHALGLLGPVAAAVDRPVRQGRSFALAAGAVATSILLVVGGSTVAVASLLGRSDPAPKNPFACNGSLELCLMPLRTVAFVGSHNAMSNTAAGFLLAEHTESISDQLGAGVRALLLDTYYGYEDGRLAGKTLVRTNFLGGVDQDALLEQLGTDGLAALDRLGGVTGTARPDARDVYFCHVACELGATKAVDELVKIRRFLEQNQSEVIHLMFEDYVLPEDTERILAESGLLPMVYVPGESLTGSRPLADRTMAELIDADARVIVTSEKHGGALPWLLGAFEQFQETPYTFPTAKDFSCAPNRGGTAAPLFLVNHWLRPSGPPSPDEGRKVNTRAVLGARLDDCIRTRTIVPNIVAVDFTALGDVFAVVRELNAASAHVMGIPEIVDGLVAALKESDLDPDEIAAELAAIVRMDRTDDVTARRVLGPLADDGSFLRSEAVQETILAALEG
jgi:hypothetical protein